MNKLKNRKVVDAPGNVISAQTLMIPEEDLDYFRRLTGRQPIAELIVILAVYGSLLKRYFSGYKGLIYSADAFEGYESSPLHPLLISIDHDNDLALKQIILKVRSEIHEVYDHAAYHAETIREELTIPDLERLTSFGLSFSFTPGKKTTAFQLNSWRNQHHGMQLCIAVKEGFAYRSAAGPFLIDFKNWLINLEQYLHLPPAEIPLFPETAQCLTGDFENAAYWENVIPLPRA